MALVDELVVLEREINALCARRSEVIHAFAVSQVEAAIAGGDFVPKVVERSIAAQVGLACGVSPTVGRKRVRVARDLHSGHARVREFFLAGAVSDQKVATIVSATAHLDPVQRAEVDAELVASGITKLGVRRAHDLARSIAARVAPEAFLARAAAARGGRRVSIRPAADGMACLVAVLPVEQAAACYASLHKAVHDEWVTSPVVTRGRGQIMADTLVECLTGQARASDVSLDIQVLVPIEALIDPGSPLPAELPDHGPIPVALLDHGEGRKMWRRLITRNGVVIGGDSRQRKFSGRLRQLIRARDGGRCRELFCDAPIREVDHIHRWADGGATSFDNGRGLCAFHNQVREAADWSVRVVDGVVITTTPTGHEWPSPTPQRHTTARARRRSDRGVPLARDE